MAKRPTNALSASLVLSLNQTQVAIGRLKKRIEEINAFDPQSASDENSPALVALKAAISQTLSDIFGHGSVDWQIYQPSIELDPGALSRNYQAMGSSLNGGGDFRPGTPKYKADLVDSITIGKERALSLLEQAVGGLIERLQLSPAEPLPQTRQPDGKVFLVHGRDDAAKNEVALFLQRIGLDAVVLHLKPNRGRHLLTKFRETSEGASFAVVLMNADDEGGLAGQPSQKRARQNVVFELGYFIGKLGPENVTALVVEGVEKPSDFDGIAYIGFDFRGGWKSELARELHAAKIPFEHSKVFKA